MWMEYEKMIFMNCKFFMEYSNSCRKINDNVKINT